MSIMSNKAFNESKLHTPMYASQPTGRRSFSNNNHQLVVESVLPDELVLQIRGTQFDRMLADGFPTLTLSSASKRSTLRLDARVTVPTLRLSLTPANARVDRSSYIEA